MSLPPTEGFIVVRNSFLYVFPKAKDTGNTILIYCSSSCLLTVYSRNINKNTSEKWPSNLFNEAATCNFTLFLVPLVMSIFFSGLLELTFKHRQEASRKLDHPRLCRKVGESSCMCANLSPRDSVNLCESLHR